MIDIVVHEHLKSVLEHLRDHLPQSLLISGPRGVGLHTIALWLSERGLAGELQPQDTKKHIDSENGTISVEMIRELYEQTRAKHTHRQIILIDDADRMSLGAQAAFLKLLEEPGKQVYFILTSHHPEKLLPTIRSRVQHTTLQPLSHTHSSTFIRSLGELEPIKQRQLQFIAEGLPAELIRLAKDESYFQERAAIVSDARDFLQTSTYKKIAIIQKYRADRAQALILIDSMLHILRRSLSVKPQHALIPRLDTLLNVRERIAAHHNIPLQLMQFVL